MFEAVNRARRAALLIHVVAVDRWKRTSKKPIQDAPTIPLSERACPHRIAHSS